MAGLPRDILKDRLATLRAGQQPKNTEGKATPKVKRGEEIFEHAGGPRTWDEYVGQKKAKGQLKAAVASARFRNAQVDHILIASGMPGVGKSALARLVAAEFGSGIVETQGSVTQEDAKAILSGMEDGDFWLIDEIHQLVVGGKSKAEWLLPLLQDGVLLSASGEMKMPKVTIIGASTNAAELPEAILSRFMVKPVIEAYTDAEAAQIAGGMSLPIFRSIGLLAPSQATLEAIAEAANNSPREVKGLLSLLRDAEISGEAERDGNGDSDITQTLEWAGRTRDGLDDLAQRFMAILLTTFGGKSGKDNLANVLGESTYPYLTEQILLQKGYLNIDKSGRWLTQAGVERTLEIAL